MSMGISPENLLLPSARTTSCCQSCVAGSEGARGTKPRFKAWRPTYKGQCAAPAICGPAAPPPRGPAARGRCRPLARPRLAWPPSARPHPRRRQRPLQLVCCHVELRQRGAALERRRGAAQLVAAQLEHAHLRAEAAQLWRNRAVQRVCLMAGWGGQQQPGRRAGGSLKSAGPSGRPGRRTRCGSLHSAAVALPQRWCGRLWGPLTGAPPLGPDRA
jgi:hypothetical protein